MVTSPSTSTWTKVHVTYGAILDILEAHFNLLGVRWMPIKGGHLIAAGIAGEIENREMGDLDIMVDPENLIRVSDYFFATQPFVGVLHCASNHRATETILVYPFGAIRLCIEIHSFINIPERFKLNPTELLDRAFSRGGYAFFADPVDALLIHLCHAHTHIYLEMRSTVCEEARILSRVLGFKWEEFWLRAEKTGIVPFLIMMLTLVNAANGEVAFCGRKSWYAAVQAKVILENGYAQLPIWYRRIFLECAFWRRPWSIFVFAFRNGIRGLRYFGKYHNDI